MNIRSELSLEIVRDNLSYTFNIPSNSTHDIAHDVCLQLAQGILEMKKQTEAQAEKAKQDSMASTAN